MNTNDINDIHDEKNSKFYYLETWGCQMNEGGKN